MEFISMRFHPQVDLPKFSIDIDTRFYGVHWSLSTNKHKWFDNPARAACRPLNSSRAKERDSNRNQIFM
ncbi:hypothetical protein DERF_008860 [Dermatophagoides farinae]|uniref:Uncharacterized protein n=1 Tax=Dermatophagoides farinae TaxID=6954 RepID=A0A922I2I4_DERFA|nr:hypothetical protein DERF_008860 [Dermatophagoides farinae]